MAQFVFLLHRTPDQYDGYSPEEIQGIVERYIQWSERLKAGGKLQGGYRLSDEGGLNLTGREARPLTDGPFSETKEVVGGLFLVEAADLEEARQLCSDCPHLAYGRIEVRQVDLQV